MRLAAILVSFLVSTQVLANSVEYTLTSITEHMMVPPSVSEKFNFKLGDSGNLIWSPISGVTYTVYSEESYHSYTGFFGLNSIGQPMSGGIYSVGYMSNYIQIGLLAGGYFQDSTEFHKRGIDLNIPGNLIPIMGFEVNYKLYRAQSKYIKLTNIFTPIAINSSVSIGKEF